MAKLSDNFYGDPVKKFEAMGSAESDAPVDAAHFKMWCRVAAAEIVTVREERDRALRNRDMWKGQCERQADQLRKLHGHA